MSKNNGNGNSITLSQMIARIDERIDLLETTKLSLVYGFTSRLSKEAQQEEPTVEERQTHATAKRQAKKTGHRSSNQTPILAILTKHGPLTSAEIFKKLNARGWTTTSTNPRALLDVTLRGMGERGKIRRIGQDWEVFTPTAEVVTPVGSVESAVQ